MKTKKSLISKIISCIVMVVLIVGVVIGNVVAYSFELQLDALLVPQITDDSSVSAAQQEGQKIASQIMSEGAVLLDNRNGVLPLSIKDDKKVNVFGYSSVDWIYGAMGNGTSGMVTPDSGMSKLVDFVKALKRYGISTNAEIQNMYKSWCEPFIGVEQANSYDKTTVMKICEAPMSAYSTELKANAEAYSKTAFVLISRTNTESWDQPSNQPKRGPGQTTDSTRNWLELTVEEEALLTYVGGAYEKVVVILNVANVFDCSFMEKIAGIDALVYVGHTGTQSVSAVPALLYGEKNFSGKTVDTYAYEYNKTSPAGLDHWFGNGSYSNGGHGVDYIEGVYVGYKWYETADYEGVWRNVDNVYGKGYNGVVQYPFGHGVSYTTFDWEVQSVSPAAASEIAPDGQIKIDVKVTNTGEVSGRDVVQAYVTLPYKQGGVEKSYVSLVGYAKTDDLAPHATQVVTIEIDVEDFTTYDCYDKNQNGHAGYELEDGEYQIKLMENSHDIKKVNFVGGQQNVDAVVKYNVTTTHKITHDPYTGKEVKNLFTGDTAIDGASLDGKNSQNDAGIPFMTRADFDENYTIPQRTAALRTRKLAANEKAQYGYSAAQGTAWDNATGVDEFGNAIPTTKPTWGANNGMKVTENGQVNQLGLELGANYDDPRWQTLLDQLKMDEVVEMISHASSGNKAVASVGKPRLYSYDSIVQMKGFTGTPRGTGNPSTIVLAQTWNKKLAYNYGLSFGKEMTTLGVQSVYGPGVNIHRSAYGGRNFEYFSEDTYITSEMVCRVIRGLQNRGRSVELKHLALNEQEAGRSMCCTWLSEQAFREIYLRPFQRAIQEENCTGLMTAYNCVGSRWAGGSIALLTGVVRGEWQFKGTIDTDWTTSAVSSADEQLRAGGDLAMADNLGEEHALTYNANSTARLQHRLREATHHVLYGWLSAAYQESQWDPKVDGQTAATSFVIEGWKWWKVCITAIDVTVGFGCAIWLVALFVPKKQKEMAEV